LFEAQKRDTDITLRFTSPTYMPSWGEGDWLDDYFLRLGEPAGNAPIVLSQDVPVPGPAPGLHEVAELVWRTIRIREEIVGHASSFVGKEPFAAVHFRGSDKFLEAPRVATEEVLARDAGGRARSPFHRYRRTDLP
jgi:hypothetical protein